MNKDIMFIIGVITVLTGIGMSIYIDFNLIAPFGFIGAFVIGCSMEGGQDD